jgi:hypothetical protein
VRVRDASKSNSVGNFWWKLILGNSFPVLPVNNHGVKLVLCRHERKRLVDMLANRRLDRLHLPEFFRKRRKTKSMKQEIKHRKPSTNKPFLFETK